MRISGIRNDQQTGVLLPPPATRKRPRIQVAFGRKIIAILTLAMLISAGMLVSVEAAAGDLDPTFGVGGKVTTDFFLEGFGSTFDQAYAVAIQSDGKIIAAGEASNTDGDFGLIRYLSDGSLDPSFGDAGKVKTDFGWDDSCKAMVIQSDGKIVAAGEGNNDFALARYNSDGSLDMSFGAGGKVTLDFQGEPDIAEAVAIQSDGKIIVGGRANSLDPNIRCALVRYNSDGSLDAGFGVGGIVIDHFGFDGIRDLALQDDGKIVIVGGDHTVLARYDSLGNIDAGFGVGGQVQVRANAVAIQSDGKIVTAGNVGNEDFLVRRFDANGNDDPTFGIGGMISTDFFGSNDTATDVVIQPDGKLVVGGRANIAGGSDFGLARYESNGDLDQTFGTGGKVSTDLYGAGEVDHILGVALQGDGKIVVAGLVTGVPDTGFDFGLARYDGGQVVAAPCPRPQGYWKNNPGAWPVNSLVLGGQTYTKAQLLTILSSSTQNDASIILARQLIAAKLNLENGADPDPISATIAHADGLLGSFGNKLPYKVKPASATGQAMTADSVVLDSYNNSILTPGCAQ